MRARGIASPLIALPLLFVSTIAAAAKPPAWTADDADKKFPKRARRLLDGAASFTADHKQPIVKASGDKLAAPDELVVIDENAKGWPRVIADTDVRIAAYLDPASLDDVALDGILIV